MILDINKKQHLYMINKYKKCRGIILVNKYLPDLVPVNKMYVINSLEDWEKVEDEFPLTMMTARCDCPEGLNGNLPSGQTFDRDRVKDYICEVTNSVPGAVIILQDMKKGTNERIYTQGGVCLDIKIGDYIYIDYVGPSFDAREICLGKATHETWNIPWAEVPFMKDDAINKYKIYQVDQEMYIQTTKDRIEFLIKAFPERVDEIFAQMPKSYKGISRSIFTDVRDKIIFPLWMQQEQLLKDGLDSLGVEINISREGILVPMEIQVPDRFKEKNKSLGVIKK